MAARSACQNTSAARRIARVAVVVRRRLWRCSADGATGPKADDPNGWFHPCAGRPRWPRLSRRRNRCALRWFAGDRFLAQFSHCARAAGPLRLSKSCRASRLENVFKVTGRRGSKLPFGWFAARRACPNPAAPVGRQTQGGPAYPTAVPWTRCAAMRDETADRARSAPALPRIRVARNHTLKDALGTSPL